MFAELSVNATVYVIEIPLMIAFLRVKVGKSQIGKE